MGAPEIMAFFLPHQGGAMKPLEMCVLGLYGGNQDTLVLLLGLP